MFEICKSCYRSSDLNPRRCSRELINGELGTWPDSQIVPWVSIIYIVLLSSYCRSPTYPHQTTFHLQNVHGYYWVLWNQERTYFNMKTNIHIQVEITAVLGSHGLKGKHFVLEVEWAISHHVWLHAVHLKAYWQFHYTECSNPYQQLIPLLNYKFNDLKGQVWTKVPAFSPSEIGLGPKLSKMWPDSKGWTFFKIVFSPNQGYLKD